MRRNMNTDRAGVTDAYSDRHSIADQVTSPHRKAYDGLALPDALCLVAGKGNRDDWFIFRLPESVDEIPELYIWLIESEIIITNENRLIYTKNRKLSVQDLNAEDWIVCHLLDLERYLRTWTEHQT